jgi:glyoxylase-like metal-dependent hydrolase (beta-lactamase superfamily II)
MRFPSSTTVLHKRALLFGSLYMATLLFASATPADQSIPDQYPGSDLYSKPVEVIPGVWSAFGATSPPTYENSGHNNNYTFIETGDGVIVINSSSYLLAKALHEEIQSVTDEAVVLVVNENGQGHAALGNSYWAEQGVPIVAHTIAAAQFRDTGTQSLARLRQITREKAEHTEVQVPTVTFDDRYDIDFGDRKIEILYFGPTHSHGDIVVWLPDEQLVVAGDIAFHERLLPIFEETDTRLWLQNWEKFEALAATYVIPGHGHPTNMAQVRRYTRDYLMFLREQIGRLLEEGLGLQDAYELDQSAYAHLDTFDELAARNAGRLFEQMEFE